VRLRRNIKYLSLLVLSVLLFSFVSCRALEEGAYPRKNLYYNLQWAYATADESIADILENPENYEFKSLAAEEVSSQHNLTSFLGTKGTYIWLKVDFNVPEQLIYKNLALYSSRMNMAVEVFLNGKFVGKAGRFPPDELSAGKIPHFFTLNRDFIKVDETNTILIKLWSHGTCSIGTHLYIGEWEDIKNLYDFAYYWLTSLYTVFEGGFIVLSVLYLILFLGQRKKRVYLIFSLLNLFSAQFSLTFFFPLFPLYQNGLHSYLESCKYYGCICLFVLIYLVGSFINYFSEFKISKPVKWARRVLLAIQLILVTFAKDLDSLYLIAYRIYYLSFFTFTPCFYYFVRDLVKKNYDRHKKISILIIGLSPFLISVVVDFIIKEVLHNVNIPYFIYFGWVLTMIAYLIVLSINYSRAVNVNEYLNKNLQMEVEARTQEIKIVNERLENELLKNHADMEMASIVQKRTFQNPTNNFIGWDIAVCYDPLSDVSGDMYDFYNVGHMLDGFSLFDVSGHGIAASLITMLSKNIIFNCYKKSRIETIDSSEIMKNINTEIIAAKGNADNYMTGLMFQISEFEVSDTSCNIQFANGGHPHPILYSEQDRRASNLLSANAVNQYGAIGFKDIDVSFQDVSFKMFVGDILVCFTDGLIEALNTEGKQFGKENVMKIVENHHNDTAEEILWAIKACLENHIVGRKMEDDLTIIVMKRQHPNDFLEEI